MPWIFTLQVVIQKQPQAVVTLNSSDSGAQSFFGVSVTCLVLTTIVCCAWPLLVCTIPALIFSNLVSTGILLVITLLYSLLQSRDNNTQGNFEAARSYGRLACGLNILALFVFIIAVIFVIVFGSVEFRVESS